MSTQVNIHEAKTHLSRLLEQVQQGQEVVIARAGKPIARLVPATDLAGGRTLGADRGQVWIDEDFDAPLPAEALAGFER